MVHNFTTAQAVVKLRRPIRQLVQSAPLRVLSFPKLVVLGHLPRDIDCQAIVDGKCCSADHRDLLVEVDESWSKADRPLVFISHSWIEPSAGRPDNTEHRKFAIVVAAVRALCAKHRLDEACVYVFFDWISVPQSVSAAWILEHFVSSLPAFIAQMSYVIVPLDSRLLMSDRYRVDEDTAPIAMNWAHHCARGW